ncbi:unnamed protein product [Musa acuminata subsp. burmannicoides]
MADSSVAITLRPPTAAAGPRKTRMHRLIEEEGIVLMPGIYDALSAAVLQSLGFRAGFVSGYAVSASRLGMPDIGLLTPPEMADAARAICAAAPNVAFIVDADTGGGNALNVQRTVKDIIATGAAGLFLEDQVWPKKCGHMQGKQVIPAEDHAAKIAAAREAIGDADFFLIARTDARATAGGLPEAIARANLYMEAGADACFVEAPRSDDELREVCKKTNGFRAANMLEGGFTPLHTPQELKELGFHLIVHSTTAVYASARALIDVLKVMKEEGTSRGQLDKLTTFEEFNSLIGLKTYNETGARFEKGPTIPPLHQPIILVGPRARRCANRARGNLTLSTLPPQSLLPSHLLLLRSPAAPTRAHTLKATAASISYGSCIPTSRDGSHQLQRAGVQPCALRRVCFELEAHLRAVFARAGFGFIPQVAGDQSPACSCRRTRASDEGGKESCTCWPRCCPLRYGGCHLTGRCWHHRGVPREEQS